MGPAVQVQGSGRIPLQGDGWTTWRLVRTFETETEAREWLEKQGTIEAGEFPEVWIFPVAIEDLTPEQLDELHKYRARFRLVHEGAGAWINVD